MTDIVLDPILWESVEAGAEASIEAWLVTEGDHVRAGQALARARLAHSTVEVPALHAGLVEEIVVPAGESFVHGAVLARLVAT